MRMATWAVVIWTAVLALLGFALVAFPFQGGDDYQVERQILAFLAGVLLFVVWFIGFIILSIIWFLNRPPPPPPNRPPPPPPNRPPPPGYRPVVPPAWASTPPRQAHQSSPWSNPNSPSTIAVVVIAVLVGLIAFWVIASPHEQCYTGKPTPWGGMFPKFAIEEVPDGYYRGDWVVRCQWELGFGK